MSNSTTSASRICSVPVIGVVGGIGSGKSAVTQWVAERYPVLVIDADRMGHQVLEQSGIQQQLRKVFGADIFDDTGRVVRSALGRKVFGPSEAQQAARRQLEAIVHPAIRAEIVAQLRALDPQQYSAVLVDAAVMLESGWSTVCDAVVFIETPEATRQARVAGRGWTPEELARREASQWPLERKRAASQAVILNSGTLEQAGEALVAFLQHQPGFKGFPSTPSDS